MIEGVSGEQSPRYAHEGVTVVEWLNIAWSEMIGHWLSHADTEIMNPAEWAEIPE